MKMPKSLGRSPIADCYPGDLLRAVLRLQADQWPGDADLLARAQRIAQQADALIAELDGARVPELRQLVSEFLEDSDRSRRGP
ncbi:hypothetical protein [Nocardia brasiliensis]|uniref:hypothetical protein n=1 Tax=Nocardia brasiliensis TaxID=37326 RepID=UPI00366DC554